DLQSQISNTFAQSLTYNVVAMTSGNDSTTLTGKLSTLPGLSKSRQDVFASVMPAAVNGKPLQDALPATGHSRQEGVTFLSTLEGYDLTNNVPSGTISAGRDLTAADAGTNNIMVSDLVTDSGPFGLHLKPGDTVTFAGADGKSTVTATIVGIYARNAQ